MSQVLVLEDERPLRTSICRDLSRQVGIDAVGAGDLREALDLLSGRPPNVLVADLSLPDGCGLDLLPELAVRGLQIPIIFITAHMERFANELPTSPNIDVLQKPFETSQLCELVRQRVERQKTAPPPPVFTVADYLQLAGMARRDVTLTVSDRRGQKGRIVIHEGQVRWASDGSGSGVEAFRRLALLPNADVQVQSLPSLDVESNISGSLDQLLLDAARSADEEARDELLEEPELATSPLPSPPKGLRAIPPLPPPDKARGLPAVSKRVSSSLDLLPVSAPRSEPAPANGPDKRTSARPHTDPSPSHETEAKETTVPPARPLKSTIRTQDVLTKIPALRAVATSSPDGSVLELAGKMDAETACAVVALAARQIDDALQTLGLGDLTSWQVSTSKASWFVVGAPDESVVALGDPSTNPIATLKKLINECGGKP